MSRIGRPAVAPAAAVGEEVDLAGADLDSTRGVAPRGRQSLIRSLHFMMLIHDLDKSPGSYRKSTIYVRDEDRDEIVFEGPDSDDVAGLMRELLEQLEHLDDNADEQPIFVTAAMAHLNLVMIHPFRDGNGRMARCLQTLILSRNQILGAEFSSIEEWLGRNTQAYYDVLTRTGRGKWSPANDALGWVRLNLTAHHMQAQTVWHRVQESEELWQGLVALAEERGLPERSVNGMFSAALGLRVRRAAYSRGDRARVRSGQSGPQGTRQPGFARSQG